MGLTDDQRALLRLLAQREEGYEDIAALKGLSVDEVRAEVRTALAALSEAPAKAPAPPVEPAPEPEVVKPDPPEDQTHAKEPAPPKQPAPTASRPSRALPSWSSLPPERRRLVALAGSALATVAVVLIAIAVFSGGGDSGAVAGGNSGGVDATGQPASADPGQLTQANLQPADGEQGEGQAVFGRVGEDEVVLQVTAEGLKQNPQGESYTVWLYRNPQVALRIGAVDELGDGGRLEAQFPIPGELLAYVAEGAFDRVHITRTADAAYRREVAQAEKQERLPRYSGDTVLRGKIAGPIVEAGENAAEGDDSD